MINDMEYIITNSLLLFFVIGCLLDVESAIAICGVLVFCCRYFRIEPIPEERLRELGFVPVGVPSTASSDGKGGVETENKAFVIAHRGGGADSPENTIEAIKQAAKNGADGVEVDLEFTKDGVAVLIHDDTVDRTTDGKGRITELTYSHVLTLNASNNHPHQDQFKITRIPTLEECIKVCIRRKLKLFIDCKSTDSKKTSDVLISMFEKYPKLHNLAVVCSFYPNVIYSLRRRNPYILTALTHRHRVLSRKVDGTERNKEPWKRLIAPIFDAILEWSHMTWLWYFCGTSFFLCHKANISQHLVERLSNRGIRLVVWTVNNPDEKTYFGQHLKCYLISDSMDPNYKEEATT
ncbi:hypothetical protein ScPMuIL_004027 [Solemya velum]